jgi:exosortase/archaeosortase family protein
MHNPRSGWLPVLAGLLACWPLLHWFAGRVGSPDDLAAGVMAAGAAIGLSMRAARTRDSLQPQANWWPAAAALGVYAVSQPFLPMTLRAFPAVLALLLAPGPWQRGRWPDPAVAGLLLLALPTTMMLELFLGYPLRLAASLFTEALLHGAGLPVSRNGVELCWAGTPVRVDAPCSGIRMLWGGLWLALTTAGIFRLSVWRTGLAAVLAVAVVTLANLLRVAALCLASAGVLPPGEPLHSGMGMAAFAAGAGLTVWLVRLLARRPPPRRPDASPEPVPAPTAGRPAFLLACLATLLIQLIPEAPAPAATDSPFPGWPATFEGRTLRATPLTPQEAAFNTAFPGRIARFEDGTRVLIWRWVTHPTHRVHSAMDCLRSSGWQVSPQPMHHDAVSGTWGCFLAERRGVRLRVREQCADSSGRIWPDVPAWFWSAWLGRSTGPWQVITVAESDCLTKK